MRKMNAPMCLRRTLSVSTLVLLLPTMYAAGEMHRFRISSADPRSRNAEAQRGSGLQPPCGKDPVPAYPRLDEPAAVKAWSASEFGRDWNPPACTGWSAVGFTTLVAEAARFRNTAGADGLLGHVGAISKLKGMRYWSTTHKRWQTLIEDAYALRDERSGERRGDFTPEEMKEGQELYFEQVDNLTGKGVYRMKVAKASPDELIVNVENVSTMNYHHIPAVHPGEMQSVYFLERESDNVWRYYGMVRTGKSANRLIAGNESSAVNRAVAFYRHFVGIPTDQEPPAAR
jgi:uncharacterized protein DUF6675